MSRPRGQSPFLLLLSLLLLSLLFAAGCGGGVRTADQAGDGQPYNPGDPLVASLDGAGATFPEPLYVEWIGEFTFEVEPDVRINYQGIGSGGGIQQLTQRTIDFGASDAPMTDEELAAAEEAAGSPVLHIPTVFGAVVLAYNLEGVDRLVLDPETLAAIFLGRVTRWDDPALVGLNPGVDLPDSGIRVVHRSDASGTTSIFTGYLAQVSPEWQESVGAGKDVDWPEGLGGQGNDGVAAVVQQQSGSLGYVELSYALETGLSMAVLVNEAGNQIEPTLEATAAAAQDVEFPQDLRFSVSNSPGEQAYPIVGATWILAYESMPNAVEAEALKEFMRWALTEGDDLARELGYAPLPAELERLALETIDRVGAR
jgi:phosphate transport system substrate-binding protein